MSSLLPQYNSLPHRDSYDHDLEELEPRPDDALLYTDYDSSNIPSRTHSTDSSMVNGSPRTPAAYTSKGKGKAVAIAYQGRPGSWRHQSRKPSFVPPIPPDLTERRAPEPFPETVAQPAPEASFIETLLPRLARPNEMPSHLRVQIDDTFKEIARRERQMQKELQRLLDAQASAAEQKLLRGEVQKETPENKKPSQSSSSTLSSFQKEKPSRQHVIPVRQPPEKRLTLGQARSRIIGVMRMLADLKAEEDAYIATALAERKSELSKLSTLKTRRQQIQHDIQEIETDPSDSLTNDIKAIQQELHTVSDQIEEYKRLLRRAEQTKMSLQRRLEEAKSEAESRLSGYKGALRECEAGIRDLIVRPNIRILELAQFQDEETGGDGQQQQQPQHITGFEFFRLRPERRTLPMARDWWEGEVAALERRRAAVERERAALEEGEAVWAEVIDTIQRHEEQLTGALSSGSQSDSNNNSSSTNNSSRNGTPGPESISSPTPSLNPRDLMSRQWDLLVDVIQKLERAHAYAEERGWTLLVAAVGAEISVYYDARNMLRDMLRSMGLSPRERSPETVQQASVSNGGATNLVDTDALEEQGGATVGNALMQEELSGSVIRRWENLDERKDRQQQRGDEQTSKPDPYADHPLSSSPPAGPPSDLLVSGHVDETDNEHADDNEVPVGLLHETSHRGYESEDERQHHKNHNSNDNQIPPEFLSLHAGDGHSFPPEKLTKDLERRRQFRRSRDSAISTENENQVPLDLLSERRPGGDDGDGRGGGVN